MKIQSTIINKLNKTQGAGNKSLEKLVEEMIFEISNLKIEHVKIDGLIDGSFGAKFTFIHDREKQKFSAKFTDVTFRVKDLGNARYDGAWRKKLYGNLISQEDKDTLDQEIMDYADDLEEAIK